MAEDGSGTGSSRAQSVADQLIGTCDSGTELLEELSQAELEELDMLAFCCNECGWWWEISEMADMEEGEEEICNECRPDAH